MNWKIKLLVINLMLIASTGYAQITELKLEDIVSRTLQNNLDLAIASNNSVVASNLATKEQAGYLPSVSLNGSATYNNNNTNLEFAGGLPPVEVNGAVNTGVGANIGVNYSIFNGFTRENNYKALVNSSKLTDIQFKLLSENLVLDAVNRFLDIQQNKLDLQAAYDNLQISRDRLQRTTVANENGSKSKLDVLSATVDFNNDSLAILSLITNIEKQKASLNVLMGIDPNTPYFISGETPVPQSQDIESLTETALNNNATILLAKVATDLAENNTNALQGQRLPQVGLAMSYGLQQNQNGAGIVLVQKTLGFNGGLSLSMPIYNGRQLKTALLNSEISEKTSTLELGKATLTIQNEMKAAQLDKDLLNATIASQQINLSLSERALERARLSYNNGQISFNDLRLAQLQVLLAKNSLNQSNINLIRLYYAVNRLSGGLISE